MYYQIIFKWKNKRRKITLPNLLQAQSLVKILQQLFDNKQQEIIGITDKFNKFYDIGFLADNIKIFNNQSIQLITAQGFERQEFTKPIEDQNQLNIDPISFASNTPGEFENDYNPLKQDSCFQLPIDLPLQAQNQILGEIHNLKLFQQLFLQDTLTIIIQSNRKVPSVKFNFYHFKGKQMRIIVYQQAKKICEIPVLNQNWKQAQNIVQSLIKSLKINKKQIKDFQNNFQADIPFLTVNGFSKEGKQKSKKSHEDQYKNRKNISKNPRYSFPEQQKPNFKRLPKDSEKGFKIFETQDQIENKSQVYQQKNQRYNIPIIIRKSNNKIQKVMASYPLSPQQINAINSLLQLQIQGLFSDQEINKVKMMVLGQNSRILSLFEQYNNEKLNVNQLCQCLNRTLKRKDSIKK